MEIELYWETYNQGTSYIARFAAYDATIVQGDGKFEGRWILTISKWDGAHLKNILVGDMASVDEAKMMASKHIASHIMEGG